MTWTRADSGFPGTRADSDALRAPPLHAEKRGYEQVF